MANSINKYEGKEYEQQQKALKNKKAYPERAAFMDAISEFIEIEKSKGLSLKQISAEFGFGSDQTLTNYRIGDKAPNLDFIKRISEVTGYDCDYLINGTHTEYLKAEKSTGLTEKSIKLLSDNSNLSNFINCVFASPELYSIVNELTAINDKVHSIQKTIAYEKVSGNEIDWFPVDSYKGVLITPEEYFKLHARKAGDIIAEVLIKSALEAILNTDNPSEQPTTLQAVEMKGADTKST